MAAILGIIVLYFVLQLLLLTVAAAIGFSLHWCLPEVNIGTGILVGLLSSIATAYFLVQVMRIGFMKELSRDMDDWDEEDEEPPELSITVPPPTKRRRRQSKKS